MEEKELATLMAKVASEMHDEAGEELTVRTIVTRVVEVVTDTESASVTVKLRRQTFETLSAPDDPTEDLGGSGLHLSPSDG